MAPFPIWKMGLLHFQLNDGLHFTNTAENHQVTHSNQVIRNQVRVFAYVKYTLVNQTPQGNYLLSIRLRSGHLAAKDEWVGPWRDHQEIFAVLVKWYWRFIWQHPSILTHCGNIPCKNKDADEILVCHMKSSPEVLLTPQEPTPGFCEWKALIISILSEPWNDSFIPEASISPCTVCWIRKLLHISIQAAVEACWTWLLTNSHFLSKASNQMGSAIMNFPAAWASRGSIPLEAPGEKGKFVSFPSWQEWKRASSLLASAPVQRWGPLCRVVQPYMQARIGGDHHHQSHPLLLPSPAQECPPTPRDCNAGN